MKHNNVPQGYKEVVVKVGETDMHFLVCRSCGCPVLLPELHKNWHKRHGG